MTQPNILIIMADQLAPHFTGAYGHSVVKTPHLDALAERGMRLDAAYCNSPLCAPSRFAFMSGQHITKISAWDNAAEFQASIPTFAHYLKSLGYSTALSGKMHFVGPDQMHGFEYRVTTDIYPSDFAWTPNWEKADERIDKWYHNMQTVKESGECMASFQIDYDDEVEFAARRKLFDYARDDTKPWCMVASFIHPHDPYVARPEWWNLYDDDDIDMPVHPEYAQDPFGQRVLEGIEAYSKPLTDHEIRQARRAYYANVSYFDSKIGALVQTVTEMGQLDNTIIIVTADHGDMLGEKGLWYKMNFFEQSARVPLVVAGPGVATGTNGSPCSLVDILPTVVDLGGGTDAMFGTPVSGRSLVPLFSGATDDGEAVGEYCAEMTGHPVFMIRRGDFKYIHCDSDPAQLYNVVADPHENTNLADVPEYADIASSFAQEVAARWDGAALRETIMASQRSRFALNAAMQAGASEDWDYDPPSDASQQYVRNHMDWTITAERFRFPKV